MRGHICINTHTLEENLAYLKEEQDLEVAKYIGVLEQRVALQEQMLAGVAVPFVLTDEMIDAARPFLLGLEIGQNRVNSMYKHLDMCGYEHLDQIGHGLRADNEGHLNKATKAAIIYTMMALARPKLSHLELETGSCVAGEPVELAIQ